MPQSPNASRLLALAGSLALSACAQSPTAPNEAPAMSPTAVSQAAPDARTLLQSLLELIRQTHRVQDITPERLGTAMGQHVATWGPSHYGFGGRVTPEWNYSAEVNGTGMNGASMDFSFGPVTPGASPDATGICALDFDAFDKALRDAGFAAQPYYGEHGELLWHRYQRDALSVEVLTKGETAAKATHACVTSVILR